MLVYLHQPDVEEQDIVDLTDVPAVSDRILLPNDTLVYVSEVTWNLKKTYAPEVHVHMEYEKPKASQISQGPEGEIRHHLLINKVDPNKKILTIKALRAIYNLSLLDAKNISEGHFPLRIFSGICISKGEALRLLDEVGAAACFV